MKKKLDPQHVFLQFLMMLLTLLFLLAVPLFIQDILWFEDLEKVIPLVSGALSVIIGNLFLYRSSLKSSEGRGFFLLGVFFFLLGVLTIVIQTTEGLLSLHTRLLFAFPLVLLLSALLILIFIVGEWKYENLTFWELFSLSLFIFSNLFLISSLLFIDKGLVEYSYIVELFAYISLTIGAGNEIYEAVKGRKGAKKAKKK